MIDEATPRAKDIRVIFNNILSTSNWTILTPLDAYAEFVRLQLMINRA